MNLTLVLMEKKMLRNIWHLCLWAFGCVLVTTGKLVHLAKGAEIRRFPYLLGNFFYPPNIVCYYNDYWGGRNCCCPQSHCSQPGCQFKLLPSVAPNPSTSLYSTHRVLFVSWFSKQSGGKSVLGVSLHSCYATVGHPGLWDWLSSLLVLKGTNVHAGWGRPIQVWSSSREPLMCSSRNTVGLEWQVCAGAGWPLSRHKMSLLYLSSAPFHRLCLFFCFGLVFFPARSSTAKGDLPVCVFKDRADV